MILISLLLAFNLLFIFNFQKISKILNIYDRPDGKLKLHKTKTPSVGGVILIINFSIVLLYQLYFLKSLIFDIHEIHNLEILSILILIYGFFFLGLYDDKFHLNPSKKIIFSILIILITILLNKNLIITNFNLTFYDQRIFFEKTSIIFTIFCFLILINSLNFYDGINGQSCLIFLAFFIYLFLKSDLNLFYLFCIIPILIIMFLNFKDMLFLGDGGIYLLSNVLAISLICEYNIKKNINYADEIFFLLLLPGLDLVRLTIRRLLIQQILSLRQIHIHHLLIRRYSLVFSNIIHFFLSILPIILFIFFKLNFFLNFSLFLIIYVFLIQFLKSSDKK